MVTVVMITYNHEQYVRQAVTSIISQTCRYPFTLSISDDASTDNTADIIQDVIATHPKGYLISFERRVTNLGMMGNFLAALASISTKYFALCEGDDYWTDRHKLETQIDFLEANENYAMCFHGVLESKNDELVLSPLNQPDFATFTLSDLAERNFIHTPSVVARNVINEFPNWFTELHAGDYPLYMLIARHGDIAYIPRLMAVYRIHGGGVWSSQSRLTTLKKWRETLRLLQRISFGPHADGILQRQVNSTETQILQSLFHLDFRLFVATLEEFSELNDDLAREWLLVEFPKQIQSIYGSRTYKLARRLAGVARGVRSIIAKIRLTVKRR